MSNELLRASTIRRTRTRSMLLCGLFAALTAIGAFITIPIPPVPFSMQIFFAILSGLILGANQGAVSVGVYILLGLVGLPVFTKGGGLSYIFQPTFGYLIGFVAGAWLAGYIVKKRGDYSMKTMLLAAFAGAGVDFVIGIPYFYLIMNLYLQNEMGIGAVVYSTFLLFLPADVILMIFAAFFASKLCPILKRAQLL